ncbi:MAG: hypothetical protein GXP29_14050 [Planctomycetes bacterium]|nr:hypothetical protein [Planctomycetota bacterium]
MKPQYLSFASAGVVATFAVGCATPARTGTGSVMTRSVVAETSAPSVGAPDNGDAVIHVSGMSCPF